MSRPRNNGEDQSSFDDRVLDALDRWLMNSPISPSVRELAIECGVNSTSAIHRSLRRLEDEGRVVQWDERKHRQWRVVHDRGME